jgi:hypothetical protein
MLCSLRYRGNVPCCEIGTPGRIFACNLLVKSQLLLMLSYGGIVKLDTLSGIEPKPTGLQPVVLPFDHRVFPIWHLGQESTILYGTKLVEL